MFSTFAPALALKGAAWKRAYLREQEGSEGIRDLINKKRPTSVNRKRKEEAIFEGNEIATFKRV